jgi:transitional endoplasmic reticulum ATPase
MSRKSALAANPWALVGGVDAARHSLVDMVVAPLQNLAGVARLGIAPARGVLLYGPPGMGKSLLVRLAADAAGAKLISVSAPDILAAGFDAAPGLLRDAFKQARQSAPAILFLNELDLLAPARTANSAEPQRCEALVSSLLVELDRLGETTGVVLIGATGRPNSIEPALLRPGRLDELIYVPVTDAAGRAAILAIQTAGVKLGKNVDLAALADRAERFTAADLDDLLRRAGLHALKQSPSAKAITAADFDAAFDITQASVTEAMEKEYEKVQGAIKQNALKLEPMGFFAPGQLKPVRDSKHDQAERAAR